MTHRENHSLHIIMRENKINLIKLESRILFINRYHYNYYEITKSINRWIYYDIFNEMK